MNRRQFLKLSSAIAAAVPSARIFAAAERKATSSSLGPSEAQGIDAGDVTTFAKDDVYDEHRSDGFFVIRRKSQLFALSAVCTHKGCKVRAANDQTYFCKCHGSTFDRDGKVTKGPAKLNLPRVAIALDDRNHVHVDPEQTINV